MPSRRTLISWLTALFPAGFILEANARSDARLSELGLQFDYVSNSIDLAITGRRSFVSLFCKAWTRLRKQSTISRRQRWTAFGLKRVLQLGLYLETSTHDKTVLWPKT